MIILVFYLYLQYKTRLQRKYKIKTMKTGLQQIEDYAER